MSNKKLIIKVMKHFGFKSYNSSNGTYFLQTTKQFKPMTKVKLSDLEKVFEIEKEEVPTQPKVDTVVKDKPKVKKAKGVKK